MAKKDEKVVEINKEKEEQYTVDDYIEEKVQESAEKNGLVPEEKEKKSMRERIKGLITKKTVSIGIGIIGVAAVIGYVLYKNANGSELVEVIPEDGLDTDATDVSLDVEA